MEGRRRRRACGLPLFVLLVCCTSVSDDGKTWSQPERLDEDQGSHTTAVALDPAGTATVLWEDAAPGGVLFALRQEHGADWSKQAIGIGGNQKLASDPNGNLVAVWRQGFGLPGTPITVWANRYNAGLGWESAVQLAPVEEGSASKPHVAMDPEGNAIAVWQQSDPSRDNIWAARSTPDDGWSPADLIETNNRGHAGRPRVAMDPAGNAMAVWHQTLDDERPANIWANRYTPAGDWGAPTQIDASGLGEARLPDVVLDPHGNATVVWRQPDGERSVIWANRYEPSGGWGVPVQIDAGDMGNSDRPRIGVDADGNVTTVWQQFDGLVTDIWSNRYTPESGWSTAARLNTSNLGDAFAPRVSVSASGHVIAVWLRHDGSRYDVWSSYYAAGAGWGRAERVDPAGHGIGSPFEVDVAANPEGNALAAWRVTDDQIHGTRHLWTARFE